MNKELARDILYNYLEEKIKNKYPLPIWDEVITTTYENNVLYVSGTNFRRAKDLVPGCRIFINHKTQIIKEVREIQGTSKIFKIKTKYLSIFDIENGVLFINSNSEEFNKKMEKRKRDSEKIKWKMKIQK